MADMTIDEIIALGETHTKAMAPKKKKKKKKKMMGTKVNQNPPGLAEMSSEDRLMGTMNDLIGHKKKMKSIFKAR